MLIMSRRYRNSFVKRVPELDRILTTSPPESLPEPRGGFALLVHSHMAVDVCGDPVGVPEHLPDDLDVSPRGDERGGRAVSESVQAHPGQRARRRPRRRAMTGRSAAINQFRR
jgi:hypothetical protein